MSDWPDTLDLFAGMGGWGTHTGVENDEHVIATRRAAGLPTVQADVSRVDPLVVMPKADQGLMASAPCPPFSTAGNGEGRKDLELVSRLLEDISQGRDSRRELRAQAADVRSVLSAEPLRWTLAREPLWTAWEQVVGAQPIWEVAADILASRGYNVWTGFMDAVEYGVPQTRRRSILIAHRTKLVTKPEPTKRVVMRDVIEGPADNAVLRMGRSRGTARTLDEPAPTMMFGKSPSGVAWYTPSGDVIRPITLQEALILQGFDPDYPVQGGVVASFGQVGNAVPRQLADAIIGALA